ncbi:MAG: hypothetical protein QGD92_13855, partial [Gammaproteobacteria bacterium]|nr:hypothetical protein [Gammaproteobacteria bacterium]
HQRNPTLCQTIYYPNTTLVIMLYCTSLDPPAMVKPRCRNSPKASRPGQHQSAACTRHSIVVGELRLQ